MNIKDTILDIVKHTISLGVIENIKVTGTTDSTLLEAMDIDRTVIVSGNPHTPVKDFEGQFGLGNLSLLSSLSKLSAYTNMDSNVSVIREERDGEELPTTFIFQDRDGSKDQYRVMHKDIINQLLNVGKFKGADWQVVFQPTVAKIKAFSEASSIYSGLDTNPTVRVSTVDGSLIFDLGQIKDGISGRRRFADSIENELESGWYYSLPIILNILKLGMSGICVMKFSNQGVCQIEIDSGLALWTYILPAIQK